MALAAANRPQADLTGGEALTSVRGVEQQAALVVDAKQHTLYLALTR
jgi:hypothetical protein